MPAIVVVDYDPVWPRLFETLRAPVADALGPLALAIEHIGSTSVPGLAAKPIVDMAVVVRAGQVADAIACLVPLGYEHKGDLGIPGREVMRHPPGAPRHHLYVCPEGIVGLTNPLALRDYLRTHPDAAREYGELKKRLAVQFGDDVDGYVEAKSPFILDVLRRCGFAPADLAGIEAMNRIAGR